MEQSLFSCEDRIGVNSSCLIFASPWNSDAYDMVIGLVTALVNQVGGSALTTTVNRTLTIDVGMSPSADDAEYRGVLFKVLIFFHFLGKC